MTGKHLLIWLGGLLALFLLVPVFATPQMVWRAAQTELALLEGAFGLHDTKMIAASAANLYQLTFVDTGLIAKLDSAYAHHPGADSRQTVPGATVAITTVTNRYLETVSAVFYIMSVRILIVLSWLPYLLPFLLGAVGEGATRRQLKYATFGQHGAALYAMALQTAVVILFLPLVYLIIPFPVSPLVVPFWAMLAAMPIIVLISNASQILPR